MVTRALSIEDGDLQTPSIITSRKVDYKDIDLSFEPKPSGDVYKKIDAAAVKQAVKNLLLTIPGERPFQPDFGAGLAGLLFELVDDESEDEIDEAIILAIENYEPRARVISTATNVAPDHNAVGVSVVFQIISTGETVELQTNITRVR